jgi:hypothetical protein
VEVHIYIGFETLKVKCTQYGICSQTTFKNARVIFFVFGRGGQLFSGGFEKIPGGGKNFTEGLPPHGSDIPKSLWGDFNVLPVPPIFKNLGYNESHYARSKGQFTGSPKSQL